MLSRRSYIKRKARREGEGQKRNYGGLRRDPKKALGTKEPEPGSRKDLEGQLETLNAKAAKMRDGFECRQCRFDGIPTRGILDAGHIYPKGKFPGGKFLISNIVGQCRDHNTRHIARPEFMLLWYEAEHGEGSLSKLHAEVLAMPRVQPIEWLREQIAAREKEIAEYEAHLSAMV